MCLRVIFSQIFLFTINALSNLSGSLTWDITTISQSMVFRYCITMIQFWFIIIFFFCVVIIIFCTSIFGVNLDNIKRLDSFNSFLRPLFCTLRTFVYDSLPVPWWRDCKYSHLWIARRTKERLKCRIR